VAGALVGRGAVLATARTALDEAVGGAGQLLLISGEPGIGKSALLAELARAAARDGARVLRGGCWSGGGTPVYWPWTQVLRSACEQSPGGVGELGPARRLLVASPAPGEETPTTQDPADARFELLDGMGLVLSRLANEAPLMVALDDLQWADEPSLQLLEFLARRLSAERVLLIGAYRDAEAGPVLRSVTGAGHLLPLGGLMEADVRALMVAVAAGHDLPDPPERLVAQVWRRSGGNPFLVRELTRLTLAQGGWSRDPSPDQAPGRAGTPVPDTVRDTLERRLARLSQPCARLLAVAAVAGPEVREEVLARVVPDADPSRGELLAEAVAARVLLAPDEPTGRHRFSHDLYWETIQAGLPARQRGELHLAVGRALETLRAGGAEVHLAEIAAHLLASGSGEAMPDAIRFSTAAADEAMGRLGYEEARRHFELALAAWERSGGATEQRLTLLLGLADARLRAGDGAGARADLHRAVELCRRTRDAAGLARAAVALHDLGARGDDHDATVNLELLGEAAAALPPEPSALRARVLTALVQSMRHQARVVEDEDRLRAAAQEAVQVARAAADPSALGFALLALHDALWQPGSGRQRLPVIEEMRAAATTAGELDLVALSYQLKAAALLEAGDPRGRAELSRYVELMAGRGHARARWEAMTRRATEAVIAGRWAEADALAVEARTFGTAIAVPDAMGVFGTLHGVVLAMGESSEGFGITYEELQATAPGAAYIAMLWALVQLGSGDVPGAGRTLAGFVVDDMAGSYDLEPLVALAVVMAPAGSDEQRQRTYARLEPHAGLHAVVGGCASYWGAVDHHLGMLAAALGWHDRAITHLEAAAAAYDRLGAPAWAQKCRERLDALAAARAPADPAGQPGVATFRLEGQSFELVYGDRRAHLPDAKGLRDIAVLLAAPGRPVPVLRLLGADEGGGADPVLDDEARTAYRRRLARLDDQLDQAVSRNDSARAAQVAAEREALIKELSAAAGLGGRPRRLGDRTERARKTVTARIRDSLRRIDAVHPELAAHLRGAISTGTTCAYLSADPVTWRL
jgi:hypothetical protein